MGNLLSLKLHGPPSAFRLYSHKRKRRSLSVVATENANPVSSHLLPNSLIKTTIEKMEVKEQQQLEKKSVTNNGQQDQNNNNSIKKDRRSSLKMTLKRAYYSNAASSNVLTDQRRQLVQVTWKEITDNIGQLNAAIKIFEVLFGLCPQLRFAFNVQTVAVDRLESCSTFVRHAGVFANVLNLAVRNIFDLETEIGPILVMFGRRHYYKHQLGFRNEYLTIFAQSISNFVNAHLSESFVANTEVAAAWRLFISYIIHKVKEGYDLECLNSRKHLPMHVY